MTTVLNSLEAVQFYTSLDPYYFTVDNRPLENLNNNVRLVASAIDAADGNADRATLAAASAGYAQLGYGQFVSGDPSRQSQGMMTAQFSLSGFAITFGHGFSITPNDQGGNPAYILPRMSVHDRVTRLVAEAGRGAIVQATFAPSTIDSRVPSAGSDVPVVTLSIKQGSGQGVFPLPDANNFVVMRINVPSNAPSLTEDHLEFVNFRSVDQTSNEVNTSTLTYVSDTTAQAQGVNTISLSGTSIDGTRSSAIDVFVDGVAQFGWTYNAIANSVILAGSLTNPASVTIRQIRSAI